MLQRERPRGVRLGIEVEAEALLSTSGTDCTRTRRRGERRRNGAGLERRGGDDRPQVGQARTPTRRLIYYSAEQADEAALQASNSSAQERPLSRASLSSIEGLIDLSRRDATAPLAAGVDGEVLGRTTVRIFKTHRICDHARRDGLSGNFGVRSVGRVRG
jgi:hypothetical protein